MIQKVKILNSSFKLFLQTLQYKKKKFLKKLLNKLFFGKK